MYVGSHFVRKGDRTFSPYWCVQRSNHVDGKSRHECIAYLGKAPTRKAAYQLARAKGILCGAWSCRELAEVDIVVDGKDARLCPDHLHEFQASGPAMGHSVIIPLGQVLV